jgi:hypothetical protein
MKGKQIPLTGETSCPPVLRLPGLLFYQDAQNPDVDWVKTSRLGAAGLWECIRLLRIPKVQAIFMHGHVFMW